MYRIAKAFDFAAAHQLDQLPEGHKCKRLHGHNYRVIVYLEAETLDERSFVVDFGELNVIKKWINETLDHRNLNDVMPYPTTAENLARFIYETWKGRFPQLVKVRVYETEKAWAEYEER